MPHDAIEKQEKTTLPNTFETGVDTITHAEMARLIKP